jgi:hypothetical protein
VAQFDGDDYTHDRDYIRLSTQLDRVYRVVSDGKWYTLSEIASKTNSPEASVSAQLRNLRKAKFKEQYGDDYDIVREHVSGGLYRYQMRFQNQQGDLL